jgi:two-component system nitrogen regulation sensor histidine kinase GlnL
MLEHRFAALDHLATMVAVLDAQGQCLFANAAFESVLGVSRRQVLKASFYEWFEHPQPLAETVAAVGANVFATSRLQAQLKRSGAKGSEGLPLHVIVNQLEGAARADGAAVLVELVEIEQQTRQEREERAFDQVRANKELIRNLAHEIKNPLGGIRGAAQLLEMELQEPGLAEYTQVIIQEADRLQALVDRLLAPHRKPHVVAPMNIHEVCERVRSLLLAQYPKGLRFVRDYDISIPEFEADREQLIQVVLNIAQNGAQAMAERMAQDCAQLTVRTRALRQVTLGKQRRRLALELHIEDNGPGIPPELRDRIFFPLVSGREGGSGLGLTLAQTFVSQHHGAIEFESVPGRTVFKILLPLA